MALQKAEAFVLKTSPFRTSSLIVTTFTRPFGKIRGVVKGVRGEGAPRSGTFEPFTLLEIVFYEKIRSDLHLISEAAVLDTFAKLRFDLERLAMAYYLTELVDQFTEPHDPHEAVFELLHFAYQWLPSVSPDLLARFFELRLLSEVGLLPHLTSCLSCGDERTDGFFFSVRQGGFFCADCRNKISDARPVHKETVGRIRRLAREGARGLIQEKPEAREDREIGELIERFLSDRLGRKLSTQRFLNQVRCLLVRKA